MLLQITQYILLNSGPVIIQCKKASLQFLLEMGGIQNVNSIFICFWLRIEAALEFGIKCLRQIQLKSDTSSVLVMQEPN